MRRTILLLPLCLATAALAGCGLKGPLVMPPAKPATAPAAAPAPVPAPASTAALPYTPN